MKLVNESLVVVGDPVTASKMLGHTSLRTTAIYVREVYERMLAAVRDLGANSGGHEYPEIPQKHPNQANETDPNLH